MKRSDAIAQGLMSYTADKPCRRGHTGPRYTSNGMCIECLQERGRSQMDYRKLQRQMLNERRAEQLTPVTIHCKVNKADMLAQAAHILNFGNAEQVAQLILTITAIHPQVSRPGEWSKVDILAEGVEYADGAILNMHRWQTEGERICIHGNWFDGHAFMAVLRGQMNWVRPI